MIDRKDITLRELLRLRHARLAWLLLAIALVVTIALWVLSMRLVEDRTLSRFTAQSLQLRTAIEERLLNYEQVLAGSAGLFSVAGEVDRADWQTYIKRVNIDRYYPGIQGIGFTRRVDPDGLSSYLESVRSGGLPDYFVHPRGFREEYHPIEFLEPATERNQSAFGYDAFQDPIHRQAMVRARDTARPVVTGRVVLVQEELAADQAGFLMYYPVYHGGQAPESLAERRMLLKGFVFSAFRTNNLLDGIVGLIAPFLDVRIYDASRLAGGPMMYASHLGSLDEEFSFEEDLRIDFASRTWSIHTRSTPAFDYLASDPRPAIVLVAGVLVSLLLFACALFLIRSRVLAQRGAGRYRAITEGASSITVVMDRGGRLTYISPSCRAILGYQTDEVRRSPSSSRVHPDDWEALLQAFKAALERPGAPVPVHRVRILDASDSWREMEGSFTSMLEVAGVEGVVLNLHDLTQLRATQSELHQLAYYDPLTGLANRELFRDHLSATIHRCQRDRRGGALMFLDLDGFKRINDSLGHDSGDQLLRQVAKWLSGCVREEDVVARLGGDEFVVLLTSVSGTETAARVADTILKRLSQRMPLNDHEVSVTVSIGITMIPQDSTDPVVLMKYADLAMYRAKELGRNTSQFFEPAMNLEAARRLLQQEELVTALDEDRFVLHYQPIVDLNTQLVVGVEAFLRWQHPERGLVSASQFIDLAEESGLIVRLGELALRLACIQIQALERAGFERLRVAVNLSVRQVVDPGFLDRFRRVITETGVMPDRLELELPAALLNESSASVRKLLEALHDTGVRLVVDDFGNGACSLSALQQLPLDAVKIDDRLIRDIPFNTQSADLASTVIALAHKLRLEVVAEGVETPHQLRFLVQAGCAQCQGNLFSYPLDEDSLISFLINQYERALIP